MYVTKYNNTRMRHKQGACNDIWWVSQSEMKCQL
jgi:hypothetical protein